MAQQRFPDLSQATGRRYSGGVHVQVDDGVVMITVVGAMDRATTAQFGAEILDVCRVCVGELVVDLSACTSLSHAGLWLLGEARRRCEGGRCHLWITAVRPEIVDMLVGAGLVTERAIGYSVGLR